MTAISSGQEYLVRLRVKDYQDTWSEYAIQYVSTNTKVAPIADFKIIDSDIVVWDNEKLEILDEIIKNKPLKSTVVYVGDGINDTPALKLSDVGVAIGGLGNDEAVNASDVVLLNNNMNNLVRAIKVSKFTKKILIENIVFALVVKFIALIIGMLGLLGSYGMILGVFADVGVCLITILNTLRILRYGGK